LVMTSWGGRGKFAEVSRLCGVQHMNTLPLMKEADAMKFDFLSPVKSIVVLQSQTLS
jgi:hypothetical protein